MSDDMDADVMPEPCRDCMTHIPPGWGWCADCEARNKAINEEADR